MKLEILLSTIVATLLIGCGGASNDDETTNTNSQITNTQLNTGSFIDAPVANVEYNTSSGITGFTDNNGSYKYKTNDKVTFKIGDVLLGNVNAKNIITPLDLADNNYTKASNIAYVLQNLDINEESDIIELPSQDKLKQVLKDINLSNEENITTTIENVKSKLDLEYDIKTEVVQKTVAVENMIDYLKEKNVISDDEYQKVKDSITKTDTTQDTVISNENITASSSQITIDNGFTSEIIGKTFYMVDYGDEAFDGKWGVGRSISFGDGNLTITDFSDTSTVHLVIPYIIKDGEIIVENPKATSPDENIDDFPIPHDKNSTIILKNMFNDVLEVLSDDETIYYVPSKDEAQNLALLLNVKDTKSYKPLIDSGKSLYVDEDYGLLAKYSVKDVKITPTQASGYSIEEGKSFTDSLNFNSDYTSYTDEDDESCHIDDVNIELGFIKEECDEGGAYFFLSETAAKNFVPLLIDHYHGEKIDPKTLDNKILYEIADYQDGTYYNVWLHAIKIDGDKINFYDTKNWVLDTNAELVDAWSENNVKVSYLSDGEIEISGDYTWGENNKDNTYTKGYVYKFDLAGQVVGQTLPVAIIANNDISLKDTLYDKLAGLKFTKGYAYCPLLFDECFFDKDAMDEIVDYYNK